VLIIIILIIIIIICIFVKRHNVITSEALAAVDKGCNVYNYTTPKVFAVGAVILKLSLFRVMLESSNSCSCISYLYTKMAKKFDTLSVQIDALMPQWKSPECSMRHKPLVW